MATYVYTQLPKFFVIQLDPYSDAIDFSGSAITGAGQIRFGENDGDGEISLLFGDTRQIFLRVEIPERMVSSNFVFASGAKILIGDDGTGWRDDQLSNTLIGGAGDDFLIGVGGNDSIVGGLGSDFIIQFSGRNTDNVFGADTVDGGAGFDFIEFPDLGGGDNNIQVNINANLTTGLITTTGIPEVGAPIPNISGSVTILNNSIEGVIGNDGNDTLVGNSVANFLHGRGGNDTLDGAGGDDTLFGGHGNDTLQGGLGNDFLRGGWGADLQLGGDGNDTLRGFGPNDSFDGGLGTDLAQTAFSGSIQNFTGVENLALIGGAGLDSTETTFNLFFSGNHDGDNNPFFDLVPELTGSALGNELTGNGQFNFFLPGAGNDTIHGGGGLDVVEFDAEDVSPGVPSPFAATGNLTVTFTGLGGGSISGSGLGNDSLDGVEGAVGGRGNDTLDGGAGNDTAPGLGSDDQILVGASGNDSIFGGGGNDTLFGSRGNDTLSGGTDTGTHDLAGYFDSESGIVASLVTNTVIDGSDTDNNDSNGIQPGTDTLISIEDLAGGIYNDSILGSSAENHLWGGAGDDTVIGSAGNDTLDGGLGLADQLRYDSGFGALQGVHVDLGLGLARDGSTPIDLPNEAALDAILAGGGHLDTISNFEWIVGPQYNDTLIGGNPNHTVTGLAFGDSVEIFEGRQGADSIDGGDHNGAGSDNGFTDIASYREDIAGVTVNLGAGTATDGFGTDDTLARIDGVWGSDFNDTLIGGSGSLNFSGQLFEFFLGGGGSDSIDGGAGTDRADYHIGSNQAITATLIDGATGTWLVTQGTDIDSLAGIEGIRGSSSADSFITTGSSSNHFFEGMAGADTISGWNGSDTTQYIRSPNGVVVNLSEFSVNTSFGSLGANSALDGFDSDSGSGGLQPYTDLLFNIENASGSDFSDTFIGQAGQDNTFDGRGGVRQEGQPFTHFDTVDYGQGGHTSITVDLTTGLVNDGSGGTDTLRNIEFVIGTGGNDSMLGSETSLEYTGRFEDRSERFRGGDGANTIDGGSSADGDFDVIDYQNVSPGQTVNVFLGSGLGFNGGIGTDSFSNIDGVFGGAGNDQLFGGSDSRNFGGTEFELFRGGGGNDSIDGMQGFDVVDYSNSPGSVNVTLDFGSGGFGFGFGSGTANDGFGGVDQLQNIEGVRGSQFNDSLTGGGNNGEHREVFEGNAGNDNIDGKNDLDIVAYSRSPNAVYVDLGNGFAVDGWGGTDRFTNIEGAQGSDFNDTLIGGFTALADDLDVFGQVFEGRAGDDLIDGADDFDSGYPKFNDNDHDVSEYRNAPGAVLVNLATGTAQDGYGGTDTLIDIEGAVGSRFNDTIIGGQADQDGVSGLELFNGRQGDDSMVGGAGGDMLFYDEDPDGVMVDLGLGTATDGWGDTDTFTGMEQVIGSQADDTIIGSSVDNLLVGSDGDDMLRGGAGSDDMLGEHGFDFADYSTADAAVTVNLATGRALDGTDTDTVTGGVQASTDLLVDIEGAAGSAFNDTFIGSDGDDAFRGGAGDDSLDGGAGSDWTSYGNDTAAVSVDLGAGTATDGNLDTDTLLSIENVQGSDFNDTLVGSAGDNIFEGGLGDDSIDGGAGSDTADYSDANGPVTIDLAAGTVSGAAGNDTLSSIENVITSAFDDTITGANLALGEREFIHYGGGNDSITGGGGAGLTILAFDDHSSVGNFTLDASGNGTITVFGENGSQDTISFQDIDGVVGGEFIEDLVGNSNDNYFRGGAGQDTLDGGAGIDVLSYADSPNAVIVNLGSFAVQRAYTSEDGESHGTQTVQGFQALDGWSSNMDSGDNNSFSPTFDNISGFENVEGGAHNDSIFGSSASNLLEGGDGNDYFTPGLGGSDTLSGGAGSDFADFFNQTTGIGITVNLGEGSVSTGAGSVTLPSIEQVGGTFFNDTIAGAFQAYTGRSGDSNFTFLRGNQGNDSISGAAGDGQYGIADYSFVPVVGGPSTQTTVNANLASGTVTTGALGTDTLSNIDDVRGGNLNDTLVGGSNSTNFWGQLFESFRGNGGNDSIDGGVVSGEDRVDYMQSTGAVTLTLATGIANGTAIDGQGGTDTLHSIENVRGSLFADKLTGGGTHNAGTIYDYEVFEGLEGNDTINGAGGFDIASYFNSPDAVTVDLGGGFAQDGWGTRDTLTNIEQAVGSDFGDLLKGSNSLTIREAFRGGAGNDTIDGGDGIDQARYNASPNAVNVNLATGIAQDGYGGTDTLISIEGARGSVGADTLVGSGADELFEGIQGDDSIVGGGGMDIADYSRDQQPITADLALGTVSSNEGLGNSGFDTLVDVHGVRGTAFNDSMLGSDGDDLFEGGAGNDTIVGGAGTDTASYRSALAGVNVNLLTGLVAFNAATGIGSDSVSGMEGVEGSDFNDTLIGGAGAQVMIGGLGNDSYTVNSTDNVITELAAGGTDTVVTGAILVAGATYTLGDNIENLTLGNPLTVLNINGTGNAANNRIEGNAGNNSLDGAAGNDTLVGGNGSDTYRLSSTGDVIIETGTTGIDTVILEGTFSSGGFVAPFALEAPITYNMALAVENLQVLGANTIVNAVGNASSNFIIGNANADTLVGGGGNDTLDGGQGVDRFDGGLGNDLFIIRNAGEVVLEAAGGGTDTVISNLPTYALVGTLENLILAQNPDGTPPELMIRDGNGNSLNNILVGNTSNNRLFAGVGNDTLDGGGGADSLYGGAGSDSYVIDGGDLIVETAGSSADQAVAAVSINLGSNVGIENASALGGVYGISITGNKQGNKIGGNETNNTLNGGVNTAGGDTLDGGAGDDTYILNSALDQVVDAAGSPGDTIQTDFSMSLIKFPTVENLTFVGTGDLVGSGNALVNILRGNSGHNLLTGMEGADEIEGGDGNDTLDGGTGADRLYGGAGNDTYVIDSTGDLIFESVRPEMVSVTAAGAFGNGASSSGLGPGTVISHEGRYIQFVSTATNLLGIVTPPDTATLDVYVKDMQTGAVTRASLGTAGVAATTDVLFSSINPSGRFVAFTSGSTNLLGVGNDTNGFTDVYLRDTGPVPATTVRLSNSDTNQQGNGNSKMSDISSDGRFVAFTSTAENLVHVVDTMTGALTGDLADTNTFQDVFLRDRVPNTLVRVSLADDETQGDGNAGDGVAISANGQIVAFSSMATNLVGVGNDTNGVEDVFVRDLGGQTTEQISVSSAEVGGDAASTGARVSIDGRYVAFESEATNLVAGDTNGVADIFLRDRSNDSLTGGTTMRVSTDAGGVEANGASHFAGISGDGVYVVFQSAANNLVAGDTNGTVDVFVKNVKTGAIARVSLSATGGELNHTVAMQPDISEDGRYIVYFTDAAMGAGDTLAGSNDVVRVANPLWFGAGDAGGLDTVKSSVTFTLGTEYEHLTLTGATAINGTGNASSNAITGNGMANVLTGLGGADTLDGGLGADTLVGGDDGDLYFVDALTDRVQETGTGGTDEVRSAVSIDLSVNTGVVSNGANVENVTLTGIAAANVIGNDGANILTGNAGNNSLAGGLGDDTLTGGLGNDTFGADAGDSIDGGAGIDTVMIGTSYSIGARLSLENITLTGGGDASATGNDAANALTGNSGANDLDGGLGNDTMTGLGGNDTYHVNATGDVINDTLGTADTVVAGIDYILGATLENLTLDGAGNLKGTGNLSVNLITGNAGANTLDGAAAADTLIGGDGADVYIVDNAGDVVTEAGGDNAVDEVRSAVTFDLTQAGRLLIEKVLLTGAAAINAIGNTLNNLLTGNTGNNQLTGDLGADTLDGGTGADTLAGGDDGDVYIVDALTDRVQETGAGGTDEVRSSVNIDLSVNTGVVSNGANIENVTLTGIAAANATGNDGANVLTGNAGNNVLTGGLDDDTLIGGLGNDTFVADPGDSIADSGGIDLVQSAETFSIASRAFIENLTLLAGGTNATGNDAANVLTGNGDNNDLDGGLGNDTMTGLGGDDTYHVNAVGDVINDTLGGGDTVVASINYTLGLGLENLALLEGAGDLKGTGNAVGNIITGNSGANILDGGVAGLQGDTLIGGDGADVYIVDALTDRVLETGAGGTDEVRSTVSIDLSVDTSVVSNGANIENVTLLTSATPVSATGNASNNFLTGNAGVNTLSGGAGADTLLGGAGNDSLVGGDDVDIADYTGTAVGVLANLAAQTVTGGAGNDTLSAIEGVRGGLGNDTFIGSTGDNVYYVETSLDVIQGELDGFEVGGHDLVYASLNHALTVGIEDLTLIGTGNISGTGNALDNILAGNSGNNYLSGGLGNDTIDGAGGIDFADYSSAGAGGVVVNLGTGAVSGAAGSDSLAGIEGVRGSSDADTLTGSGGFDRLDYSLVGGGVNVNLLTGAVIGGGNDSISNFEAVRSGAGADTLTASDSGNELDGGAGADSMAGGGGNDTFMVDNVGDTLSDGEGTDIVFSTVNFTLATGLENLTLLGAALNGTGNEHANLLTGNAAANSLNGGSDGADTLDGGAGMDTLTGGVGNDLYIIDNIGDKVIELLPGDGTDTVQSSVLWTLGANFENLVLTGSANLNGTGNELANAITGNSGNNVLDGKAGAAGDTMTGLGGNDTYVVDNVLDQAIEGAAAGTDLVLASVSFTLGADLENLTLTGLLNINGTGNSAANLITGNAGNNSLDGGGGADTLVGGLGNDIYTTEGDDVLTELAAAGTDTVRSTVDFTLGATFENLLLLSAAAGIGTGNAAANLITGNIGNDTLTGLDGNDTLDGGAGNDSLSGGLGNDLFVVDAAGDLLTDVALATSIDTVQASVDWTLGGVFENLVLTGVNLSGTGNILANQITGGTGNDTLTGDAGNDTLTGGAGNDSLVGGTGSDSMAGGAGDDSYVVDATTDAVSDTGGIDTLYTPFTTVLAPTLENLTLTGASVVNGTGNLSANILTGNGANNLLAGLAGADTISGGGGNDTLDGGLDADSLTGGAGDDRFIFDNPGDSASEGLGEGTDTIVTSTSTHTLQDNFENLVFTGLAAATGIGNTLANQLTGGAGNDTLTGDAGNDTLAGGAGNDSLAGGDDNDTFIWDPLDIGAIAVSGGAGEDTLKLAGSGQTLDLTGIPSTRYESIERVNIGGTGVNTFKFNPTDVRDLSDTTDTLYIDGDLFDVVDSQNQGWELLGAAPDGVSGILYFNYRFVGVDFEVQLFVNQDTSQFIT